jgi:hypothetical protein
MGSDPEIFIRDSDGHLVDSFTALAKASCTKDEVTAASMSALGLTLYRPYGTIVTDGVQAEVHPDEDQCIALHCTRVFGVLKFWAQKLLVQGLRPDFTQTLELTEDDINRFDPACRQLGCQPSMNIYEPDAKLGIDPVTYKWRSAGGHIHIGHGLRAGDPLISRLSDIVPLLDVLVGNTSVLIDRDPLASQRRKVYGRAGEFRLPNYGLEYRTLSNFWLRAPQLHSLIFELARLAFQTAVNSTPRPVWDNSAYPPTMTSLTQPEKNFAGELMSCVNISEVREAIDSSNFDLALANFSKIRSWIEEHWIDETVVETTGDLCPCFPLTKRKLADFDFFVKKGYEFFLGNDPLLNLMDGFRDRLTRSASGKIDPGHADTWNNLILEVIRPMRLAEEKATELAALAAQGAMVQELGGQADALQV